MTNKSELRINLESQLAVAKNKFSDLKEHGLKMLDLDDINYILQEQEACQPIKEEIYRFEEEVVKLLKEAKKAKEANNDK